MIVCVGRFPQSGAIYSSVIYLLHIHHPQQTNKKRTIQDNEAYDLLSSSLPFHIQHNILQFLTYTFLSSNLQPFLGSFPTISLLSSFSNQKTLDRHRNILGSRLCKSGLTSENQRSHHGFGRQFVDCSPRSASVCLVSFLFSSLFCWVLHVFVAVDVQRVHDNCRFEWLWSQLKVPKHTTLFWIVSSPRVFFYPTSSSNCFSYTQNSLQTNRNLRWMIIYIQELSTPTFMSKFFNKFWLLYILGIDRFFPLFSVIFNLSEFSFCCSCKTSDSGTLDGILIL